MEPDFKASKMEDEEEKVKTAISYLIDDATLWWRRRYADLEKGLCRIKTWEELKIGQGREITFYTMIRDFFCYVCSQLEPVEVGATPLMNRKFAID